PLPPLGGAAIKGLAQSLGIGAGATQRRAAARGPARAATEIGEGELAAAGQTGAAKEGIGRQADSLGLIGLALVVGGPGFGGLRDGGGGSNLAHVILGF